MEVVDYPNYLIYNDGRVYSKPRPRTKGGFLKQETRMGYNYVVLSNGKRKGLKVHRLVALHYLPKIEGKNEVDHIDRDTNNNHVSNLRWVNSAENNYNRGVQKHNKLGIKYLSKNGNTYIFNITRKGKRHFKCFNNKTDALWYKFIYLLKL